MNWDQIVGNDGALKALRTWIEKGTLPHALVFSGAEGIGKKMAAYAVASALNCQEGGCGTCPDCRAIAAGKSPWVNVLEAEKDSISIEQAKGVPAFLSLLPPKGRRLVVVVDGMEMLTAEAANALLKVIEEPPEGSIIIGITSSPNNLIPTVLSRCRVIRFLPLSAEEMKKALGEEEKEEMLGLASGSPGRALYWKSVDRADLFVSLEELWEKKGTSGAAGSWLRLRKILATGEDKDRNVADFFQFMAWKLKDQIRSGQPREKEKGLAGLKFLENCWESLEYNVDGTFASRLTLARLG